MGNLLLALDFGGTKHTAGVIGVGETHWREHKRAIAKPNGDAGSDLATMRTLAYELLDGEKPDAIGVSFGGPVNAASGTVRLSHHVAGWEDVPLRALLQQEFDAPVAVDNDANVGALGEHRFGAGRGLDSLLYMTVSTGVGGGWILYGKIWHGADGMAGEIGHTVVDPHGPVCLCGKRGCLERFASGPYIAMRAREWLAEQPERGSLLRDMASGHPDAITAQMVSAAAAEGDELAWDVLHVSAWALGMAVGNTVNLMTPACVVMGGGVTKSGDRFWQVVRRVARETALPQMEFEVMPAELGDDAPLWGAVALAQEAASVDAED
jgi:glucokinase